MMPRKKRITIIVISIILILLMIVGILGFLYLETDILTSKEKLFAKYLIQNFDAIQILKSEDTLEIKSTLDTNKYTSELKGNIEYTENIGTSDQNQDSKINDVGIKINSNVDKTNNYNYKDISIGTDDNDLVKLEYINEDENYGIRLNGIQQFVSIENDGENEILKQLGIENTEIPALNIDINSIFNFTEEEKQTLMSTYLGIIQQNVPKDRYFKQSNSLITINNKDIETNAYYVKLTIEEYNNINIKILEQITKDEIILTRVDLIEEEIKKNYSNYEQEKTLRESLIDTINNQIQEIQNINIGNEEVKITVYENNKKTVRTSIEKTTNKLMIDLYDDSSIKIDNVQLGENVNEQFIKIEKSANETQSNILIELEKIEDNEVANNIQLNYQQTYNDNEILKATQLEISNEKYKTIFNIENNIEIVQEFEDEVTLEEDNVKLNELSEEQVQLIGNIVNQNIQNQISNLFAVVSIDDYTNMLKNLGIIKQNVVEMPSEVEVTDVERKRFNSQFEFFESENLTIENIKDLIEVAKSNFRDMKVLLENGDIKELDIEMLEENTQEATEYKESISEILIGIKENTENKEKEENTLKYFEKNSNNKYTVSLEYDDNGLVEIIRIKIQEED